MPGVKVFIDTNVLLYTRQNQITEKVIRAKEWLVLLVESRCARINLQVLNEMTNVLLRKRNDLTAREIFGAADELLALGAPPITEETISKPANYGSDFSTPGGTVCFSPRHWNLIANSSSPKTCMMGTISMASQSSICSCAHRRKF
ncbi:hypothetical protein [Phyllobacterium phragmitis]|uniref:hypothetical protein n=1 Tax=Phyllobacterium phragmitis TaxID=2670329 RepID=UPI0038B3D831